MIRLKEEEEARARYAAWCELFTGVNWASFEGVHALVDCEPYVLRQPGAQPERQEVDQLWLDEAE